MFIIILCFVLYKLLEKIHCIYIGGGGEILARH